MALATNNTTTAPGRRSRPVRLLLRVWHTTAVLAVAAVALPVLAVTLLLEELAWWNHLPWRVAQRVYAMRNRITDPLCRWVEHRLAHLTALGHRPPWILRPALEEPRPTTDATDGRTTV